MPRSVASGTHCIRTQSVPRSKHSPLRLYKTSLLMLYMEQVNSEHLNAMWAPRRNLNVKPGGRLRLKCDGTRAETRFRLSAKRTSPFKSASGRQFSRLLAAEVCASAVVMLDTPCYEVECKTTGYPLHLPVSPSLPLPCVTVCHHISTGLCFRISV